MIGDTWYPTESMRTMKYLIADSSKKNQGYKHWVSLEHFYMPMGNVKYRVFLKLDSRYGE